MGQDVMSVTLQRLPVTIALSAYALVITLVLGLASGILAALRHNTWIDQFAMMVAMLGISIPNFFLGLLMIIFFAVQLGWLPTGGYIGFTDDPVGWLRTSTMPAISLALLQVGLLARITRSTMLEVLRQDYIRTAWAKGLTEKLVVVRHALRNALIPVVTLIGLQAPILIGGSVIVEQIFVIPGMGLLLLDAISQRDYPIITSVSLVIGLSVMLINLAVDLSYGLLDPKVRYR
jgi:peptide/nickel transport system permease protein